MYLQVHFSVHYCSVQKHTSKIILNNFTTNIMFEKISIYDYCLTVLRMPINVVEDKFYIPLVYRATLYCPVENDVLLYFTQSLHIHRAREMSILALVGKTTDTLTCVCPSSFRPHSSSSLDGFYTAGGGMRYASLRRTAKIALLLDKLTNWGVACRFGIYIPLAQFIGAACYN